MYPALEDGAVFLLTRPVRENKVRPAPIVSIPNVPVTSVALYDGYVHVTRKLVTRSFARNWT